MNPTVLIVDDEKHTREGLRSSLEESFDVYLAGSSQEALATMLELARDCDDKAGGVPCVLLCNKVDLLAQGQQPDWPVVFDPGRWPHFLTSAKDDTNVTEAFEHTANAIARRGL